MSISTSAGDPNRRWRTAVRRDRGQVRKVPLENQHEGMVLVENFSWKAEKLVSLFATIAIGETTVREEDGNPVNMDFGILNPIVLTGGSLLKVE